MTTTQPHDRTALIPSPISPYEPPTLTFVGPAADVVLGLGLGSWDGDTGYAPPMFEFEPDGFPID